MSDEQQHGGGVAWEAGQALKLIRRAREDGDADGEDLGWLRYAEALTNASYSGAAAAFIGILKQREDATAERDTRLEGCLQRLITVTEAGTARLGKLEDRVEDLDTRHGEQWRQAINQWKEAIAQWEQARIWLEESRTHRARLQERSEVHEREIRRLNEWIATLEGWVRMLENRVRELEAARTLSVASEAP